MAEPSEAFHEIRHPKKRAYLAALVEAGGNISRACIAAEIDRSTPYSDPWKEDAAFQAALRRAEAMAADHLEAEAIRRAYEGVEEPVGWHKGEPGGMVRRYSDTLLIFLLNGSKPKKYVTRTEISGPDGGPIEVSAHELRSRLASRIAGIASRIGADGGHPGTNGNGAHHP